MKVLTDGSYQTENGETIPADKVGKLYRNAPRAPKAPEEAKTKTEDLEEGQSSGVIDLVE